MSRLNTLTHQQCHVPTVFNSSKVPTLDKFLSASSSLHMTCLVKPWKMYLNLLFLLPLLVAAEPLPKPVCGGELPWQLVRDPSFELPAPKTGINEGRWTVNVTALPPSASGPSPQYDTSGSLAQSGVGAL